MKLAGEVIIVYGVSIGLQPQSSAKLIARIKEGLSVKAFDRLCKNLDISEKALAKTLNIAISTLARRKKTGRMTFGESERIYRIARLYDRAVEVFGDKKMGRKWLKEPAWALGDLPPLEYAETEFGAQEVDDLLGRIEHGVFT
jgi:putative toxin-antitoxin system antitoxin component (TIGR02293 family)